MRYLALDIGERRIGLALSESGLLATPHSVLPRKSKKEDFARLQQLIVALEIDCLVVGLPYSLSEPGRLGPQARRIKRYAEALAEMVDVPLDYFDESYSTVDAEAYLSAGAYKPGKKPKTPVDAAAAAVILQNYLDNRRSTPLAPA